MTTDPVAAAVARAKREVLDDIASGRVPATVSTFSELHDYVDANEYGGLCDTRPWVDAEGFVNARLTDAANKVQEAVHQWLAAGRPK